VLALLAGHGMAVDVEQVTVPMPDASTAHLLILANYVVARDPESDSQPARGSFNPYQTRSQVLMFDTHTEVFRAHQTLSTQGPTDLETFFLFGYAWLLIANSFDGSYSAIQSVLYRWERSSASFVQHQLFPGNGARQWKYLSCGTGREFLALAQSSAADEAGPSATVHTIDIWHWRHHLFPASPPASSSTSAEAEQTLEGFSWVHVQTVQTAGSVHIEGGLFGASHSDTSGLSDAGQSRSGQDGSSASSVCQLVLVAECDACSHVLQLIASGLLSHVVAEPNTCELLLTNIRCADLSTMYARWSRTVCPRGRRETL